MCSFTLQELAKLEEEDAKLEEAGYYDSDEDPYTEQDYDFVKLARKIKDKIVIDNINRRLDIGKGIRPTSRASRAINRERTTTNLRWGPLLVAFKPVG